MDLSVVITCFNRRQYLDYALASFAGQNYPMDRFEVIVVDDGSTDGTIPHIQSQKWPFRLKTVKLNNNRGISYARNRGIDAAEGKIVVFSDSDIIVPRHYLKRHWQIHQQGEKLVVSAPYRYHIYTILYPEQLNTKLWKQMVHRMPELQNKIPRNFKSDKRPIALLKPDEVRSGYINRLIVRSKSIYMSKFMKMYPDLTKCPMPWLAFAGSNSSVARESLLRIRGFDEALKKRHDDRDIGYRLHLHGHTFVLDKGIIATHQDHLLKHERKKVDYYRYHDLAIMLKNHPHLDMFLFGLYQTDKEKYRAPVLTRLKEQMLAIKSSGGRGRKDYWHMKRLLRYHVIHEILKVVSKKHIKHIANLPNPKQDNSSWLRNLQRYDCKEFLNTAEFLVKQVKRR